MSSIDSYKKKRGALRVKALAGAHTVEGSVSICQRNENGRARV